MTPGNWPRLACPSICAGVFLLLAGIQAHSDTQDQSLKEQIARLAEPVLIQRQTIGIAIGILGGDGQRHYYAFGRVSTEGYRAPNEDTLFELGSITKCFTGILLADMVLRNEVRLDETAESLLPRGAALPRVGGRPITLEELATYSAGLPRMPDNMGRTYEERAHYSPEKMFEFLRALASRERGAGPERHYLYSNLGFALLGHCLGDRAREPIRPLLISRVVRPLGMESTCFQPGPRLEERVARTYDKEGKPVPPWETGAIAPAGMLRSSSREMVRFLAANVGRERTPLADAIQFAQRPRYQTGTTEKHPHNHDIGLAWFIDPQTGFIAHDGATAGSSANVVFDPKSKIGVVVLMNQQGAPVVRMSLQIMRLVNKNYTTDTFPPSPRGEEEEGPSNR